MRGDSLGDHLGNGVADHVHTENLTVLFIRNDFDESFSRVLNLCLADRGERKLSDLHFIPCFMALASVNPTLATCGSQYVHSGTCL